MARCKCTFPKRWMTRESHHGLLVAHGDLGTVPTTVTDDPTARHPAPPRPLALVRVDETGFAAVCCCRRGALGCRPQRSASKGSASTSASGRARSTGESPPSPPPFYLLVDLGRKTTWPHARCSGGAPRGIGGEMRPRVPHEGGGLLPRYEAERPAVIGHAVERTVAARHA